MASAVDSRLAYARLSAVATASRLPTANRGSNNSYTTSWDTTELNQPLSAIMNYVQASRRVMAAGGGHASDKVYGMMDKPIDQVDRAGAIIRRLRAFVEKGEIQRFEEDINKVVEEASALALIGAGEKGITVGLELGANLPPVLIDKVQIQ